MIEKGTAKVCQIADARMVSKVGKVNLFGDEDLAFVEKARKKYYDAKEKQDTMRQNEILRCFRENVNDFIERFGVKPTMCLMNYRDLDKLCDAYNEESERLYNEQVIAKVENAHQREYISTSSSSDDRRFIDNIKVKQGCDQKPSELRFYSAER